MNKKHKRLDLTLKNFISPAIKRRVCLVTMLCAVTYVILRDNFFCLGLHFSKYKIKQNIISETNWSMHTESHKTLINLY